MIAQKTAFGGVGIAGKHGKREINQRPNPLNKIPGKKMFKVSLGGLSPGADPFVEGFPSLGEWRERKREVADYQNPKKNVFN